MNIGDGDTETTAPVTDPTDEPTQETTTVVTSEFWTAMQALMLSLLPL